MKAQILPWMDPLGVAAACYAKHANDAAFAFLHSAARTGYSGRYSYLGINPREIITGENLGCLAPLKTKRFGKENHPLWIGSIGYEAAPEAVSATKPHGFNIPNVFMVRYHTLFVFDHTEKHLIRYGQEIDLSFTASPATTVPEVVNLASNMDRAAYLDIVQQTIERIHAGAFYQANITRKFFGQFENAPEPFDLYRQLQAVNPAPFSAFVKQGNCFLISCSPERFLKFDGSGKVSTRPIKGTAARHHMSQYQVEREHLRKNDKDRSENLMIVDLMRHDLASSCEAGSVRVDAFCEVDSFPAIHHLSSDVSGTMKPEMHPLCVIANAFPPGSMTGAPKIAAMQWCAQKETVARGPYSGTIGWLGADGSGEFSVTIRTLILENKKFEMQAGGGVVADSIPLSEWQESLQKLQTIAKACGITRKMLEAL